jgi:hypothetical protein
LTLHRDGNRVGGTYLAILASNPTRSSGMIIASSASSINAMFFPVI